MMGWGLGYCRVYFKMFVFYEFELLSSVHVIHSICVYCSVSSSMMNLSSVPFVACVTTNARPVCFVIERARAPRHFLFGKTHPTRSLQITTGTFQGHQGNNQGVSRLSASLPLRSIRPAATPPPMLPCCQYSTNFNIWPLISNECAFN